MLRMDKPPRARKHNRPVHPVVQALRLERYRRGITSLDLAESMGYSQKALFQWEVGISAPKITHLQDWADALGMRITVEDAE